MAFDGGTLVGGAPADDDRGQTAGAAYAYRADEIDIAVDLEGEAAYEKHVDYSVRLSVVDDAGNSAADSVDFVLDIVPPLVGFLRLPDAVAIPASLPFSALFAASDDDGAAGGPVLEQMFWDGCLLFDGATFGDGDGLLQDEVMTVDRTLLCDAIDRCGLPGMTSPEVSVEVTDCAGNRRSAKRTMAITPEVQPTDCPGG